MEKYFRLTVLLFLILFSFSSCSPGKETAGDGTPDLNGKTVACVGEGFGGEVAHSLEKLGCEISGYSYTDDCFSALENKKTDFVVTDEITAQRYINRNEAYKVCDNNYGSLDFCAVFKKNSPLTEKFNDAITALAENGTIQKIKDAYKSDTPYIPASGEYEKTLVMAADEFSEDVFFCDNYGEYSGIDYCIACEICSFLGYNLSVHILPFDEMFTAADDGSADFLMSSITPTPERLSCYDFSDSYFTLDFVLVGR